MRSPCLENSPERLEVSARWESQGDAGVHLWVTEVHVTTCFRRLSAVGREKASLQGKIAGYSEKQ